MTSRRRRLSTPSTLRAIAAGTVTLASTATALGVGEDLPTVSCEKKDGAYTCSVPSGSDGGKFKVEVASTGCKRGQGAAAPVDGGVPEGGAPDGGAPDGGAIVPSDPKPLLTLHDGGDAGKKPKVDCEYLRESHSTNIVPFLCTFNLKSPYTSIKGTFECGDERGELRFEGEPAKPDSAQPVALGSLPPSVWAEILGRIGVSLGGARLGSYYNRREDVAVLFFNKSGAPFFPMPDVIDEDDDIYVVVVDRFTPDENGTPISLSGCNRPPLDARINGGILQATTSGGFTATGGEGGAQPSEPELRYFIYPYGKCAGAASGGPQLKIDQQTTTISVNPLYRFSVGVAAAYDNTAVREFSLRTPPGDGIARIAQSDDRMGLSSLIYISFYPVARDFRKTDFFLAQRLQLFIGLDPRAFDEHIVGGLGYELTMGLNALVGWRFLTRQPVLAEGSGLSVGDAFDGTAESLPTRKRWEMGSVFFGVGLSTDLLARLR